MFCLSHERPLLCHQRNVCYSNTFYDSLFLWQQYCCSAFCVLVYVRRYCEYFVILTVLLQTTNRIHFCPFLKFARFILCYHRDY